MVNVIKIRNWFIFIMPFIVGIICYCNLGYSPSKLVLEIMTGNNCTGQIYWDTGKGYSEQKSSKFAIKGSAAFERYEVNLPKSALRALRIDPIDKAGEFEIRNIMLQSGNRHYLWQGIALCRDLTILQDINQRQSCDGTYYGIATTEDPSFEIKDIPNGGFQRGPGERIALSFVAACIAFMLSRFISKVILSDYQIKNRLYAIVAALIAVAVYGIHFYFVFINAVNVPNRDDWNLLQPHALSDKINLKWVFAFHNEHRIAFTKLISWVSMKIDGLNFANQQVFNFIIFGMALMSLCYLKKKVLGAGQFPLFPMFLIFMTSPVTWENHSWAFQSQFHLALLFSTLAIATAFSKNILLSFLTSILAICAMYSMSSGVIIAITIVIMYCLFATSMLFIKESFILLKPTLITIVILIMVTYYWFIGYVHIASNIKYDDTTNIYHLFEFFFNLISFGFGFTSTNLITGIFCFSLVIVPLIILLLKKHSLKDPAFWQIATGTIGFILVALALSVGRAPNGLEHSKYSRYNELTSVLIIYSSLSLWLLFKNHKRFQSTSLIFLWFFCFFGYKDNWSFDRYRFEYDNRMLEMKCISDYYKGIGEGKCQDFPIDQSECLNHAKKLNISFTRK